MMGNVILLFAGLALLGLGYWLNRRLLRATAEYTEGAPTTGGKVARDMTMGNALFHAWLLMIIGAAAVIYAGYRMLGALLS